MDNSFKYNVNSTDPDGLFGSSIGYLSALRPIAGVSVFCTDLYFTSLSAGELFEIFLQHISSKTSDTYRIVDSFISKSGSKCFCTFKDEEENIYGFTVFKSLVGKEINGIFPNFMLSDLRKIANEYPPIPKEREPNVYDVDIYEMFKDSQNRTQNFHHPMDNLDFNDIKSFLYPGIEIDKMIKSYIDSEESVLILVGKPGIGKTCLIKKILSDSALYLESNTRSIYVKDSRVLHSAEFWSELSDNPPDFLILDDLDNELTPRDLNKDQNGSDLKPTIVNQLLSFSDGLFPIHTKVLITTNLTDEGIDKAILRPGRCFDVLKFKYMKRDYAKNIWINEYQLTEEQFEAQFPDMEEITQANFCSEMESVKSDNTRSSYLTDPEISQRKAYI